MKSVAFSPDGKAIAATPRLGADVFVYDASTLKRINVLLAKAQSSVGSDRAVAYARDGALLATTGIDHPFILWNVTTGRESLRIPRLMGALDVAFSPTSDLLATAGPGEDVILWAVGDGRPHAVLKGHSAAVTTIAFSADGKLLASGGADKMVILWSVEAERQVGTVGPLSRAVRSVSFSPDARMLATICDGELKLWKLDVGQAPATLSESVDMPSRVEVVPALIWALSVATAHPISLNTPAWGPAIFSPDGKRLAVKRGHISVSGDYEIVVVDVDSKKAVTRISCQCFGMAFSPDGTRLATAGHPFHGGPVQLWDVSTGKELR